MTQRLVARSGVGLSVHDDGDPSAPAVLLLHGFPDSADLWVHQRSALVAAGYRVVAPDQRGFGRSGKPADVSAYALKELLGDVAAVLDELGIEQASVVGHDIGSVLGWLVAASMPARVRCYAALAVGFPAGGLATLDLEQWQHWWYMLLFQSPGVAEAFLPTDGWRPLRLMLQGHPDPDRVVAALEPEGALAAAVSWYRANVPPQAWASPLLPPGPVVRVPVLGVWSTGDAVLGADQMTRSGSYCTAGWRFERLDGPGHWFPVEAPDATNRLLLDFLADPG